MKKLLSWLKELPTLAKVSAGIIALLVVAAIIAVIILLSGGKDSGNTESGTSGISSAASSSDTSSDTSSEPEPSSSEEESSIPESSVPSSSTAPPSSSVPIAPPSPPVVTPPTPPPVVIPPTPEPVSVPFPVGMWRFEMEAGMENLFLVVTIEFKEDASYKFSIFAMYEGEILESDDDDISAEISGTYTVTGDSIVTLFVEGEDGAQVLTLVDGKLLTDIGETHFVFSKIS